MSKKIRIAFIKFGGLAAGGTEKLVQSLAANLDKKKFAVDYFWCHGAPYVNSDFKFSPTSSERMQYMKDRKVNLIEFNVAFKNVTVPTHDWIDTNFWDKFKEANYDIVVTGRAGHSEYPFHKIKNVPIVDVISLAGHVDHQTNIVKSVHISQWQKNMWIQHGGNADIAEFVPIFDELPPLSTEDFRAELSIDPTTFVYGFHQRAEQGIYSPVPLAAFAKLQEKPLPLFLDKNVAFIILGGADLYRAQASEMNIKNVHFLEHTGDPAVIGKFLKTLNVYSHGRRDGETAGLAIIEALRYGLPVISHTAPAMGHVETIGNAGKVCDSVEEYCLVMNELYTSKELRDSWSLNAKNRYAENFDIKACVAKYEHIFEEVYKMNIGNKYTFKPQISTDAWLQDWVQNEQ